MRTVWICPVWGCRQSYSSEEKLRGHMGGAMQYDSDHKWENTDLSHDDLSEAKFLVPGDPDCVD